MRHSVLIVEDNIDVREMLAAVLEHWGFSVDTARDGLDGVEKAGMMRPDVVLMDISMPRLDGIGASERIKAEATTRAIPIIGISAYDSIDRPDLFVRFLHKPVLPTELLVVLKEVLTA